MIKPGRTGLSRVWFAMGYSWQGLRAAWQHEAAFRQEMGLLLVGCPLAVWLGQSNTERAILLASLWLVPIVELLNSALEAVVDRIGPEHHELSGRAKDIGSAAVLLALCQWVMVWGVILW